VRDEDAGLHARCPQCGAVKAIPTGSSPSFNPGHPAAAPTGTSEPINPYASPPTFAGEIQPLRTPTGYVASHRGSTLIVLGVLGILCCPICAPIPWILGANDLKKIDSGTMDPAGRTQTKVGMILGIVGTGLLVLRVGLMIVMSIVEN
jgi:hypothetical protein